MEQQLNELKEQALAKIQEATNVKELNEVRVAYLGRKGPITDAVKRYGEITC